jgi:hypothetical protein
VGMMPNMRPKVHPGLQHPWFPELTQRLSPPFFLFFFCSHRKLDGHGDWSQIILFIQFFLCADMSKYNFLMEEIYFG